MSKEIQGKPTKRFFIDMITRDVSIEDAIIDLIDNSIDGANRMRPAEDSSYEGLYVKLSINKDSFMIEDNCGGFSLETAKKYAFRFGRPDNVGPVQNNSVGRFGIGMKRSLFKMGRLFSVESKCNADHFIVNVDVDTWEKKTKNIAGENVDDWNFEYILKTDENQEPDGTKILVSKLNEEFQKLFKDDCFFTDLEFDIERVLNFSLSKKLDIYLNEKKIKGDRIELLMSESVKPYFVEGETSGVHYKIIAGLGQVGTPKDSGWYIFCNNRLVVEADKTSITGWHVGSVPQWRVIHAMFRGLLFLDCEDTIKLPLTTTKKGIDATAPVYQNVLPLMEEAILKINFFLNKVTQLDPNANDYRDEISKSLNKYSAVELKNYDFSRQIKRKFFEPDLDINNFSTNLNQKRISYSVDKERAELAKEHANVKSFKDLGLKTFDYYTKMEGLDDE